ncbi:protein msta-like [Cephus cinctus]|uniref:Protein msta-like n=1 Tax=Cephus cinctus TaxID=211228 RepID=A0AAJ7FTQ6_CEPCN|nr:protein msta-like [Cephus cinctus]XP_015607742.1 protein msta-like [Cephus cinctus]XP_024946859.1 protein msta-like [Cephus cinctus]
MTLSPEVVERLLHRHLEFHGLGNNEQSQSWTIKKSSLGGRGMFATRKIDQGELIFVDAALVVGPRRYSKYLPMCVGCYKSSCPLFPCDRECGLPVCSKECEDSPIHVECSALGKWGTTCGSMWSSDILQAVLPIRALSLPQEQKDLVYALECHEGPRHGMEVDLLIKNVRNTISSEDEAFMRRVCGSCDTNSFETAVLVANDSKEKFSMTSLRGLYPMGAMQNHSCVPNTRHHFDNSQKLFVSAARPIDQGEELTMTYTELLWDTTIRRQLLVETKHFLCSCQRCSDPLEFGSLLGALKCANQECSGILLPDDSLNMTTAWTCRECGLSMTNRQIKSIHSALASIIQDITKRSPRRILRFLLKELPVLVPKMNYVVIDLKFTIVSYFGRTDNISWKDLTDQELEIKREYCKDLIHTLDILGCGDCKKKGLILYELYCTNLEIHKRSMASRIPEKYKSILRKSIEILQNDLTVPNDYEANCQSLSSF